MDEIALTELADVAVGTGLAKSPTGIRGLDQVTGGGLPSGRVTLVAGGAGAGKSLLGLSFLVNGARDYGEPGVLLTFEESAAKVTANVRSLGFDLEELIAAGTLAVLSFRLDPAEIFATGEFDLEPLFMILDEAIERVGARRVVLDTIEVLFGALGDDATVRAELSRLARWLEDRGVTAVVTAERGDKALTRTGIEEYVSDCVIVLDHRVVDEITTRRLRVLKYRGSAHGTNEYPFFISARGFVVLPVTAITLDYAASEERISTGVPQLDQMLGGGVFRGATVLLSGMAGTGKTSLAAYLLDAACARGERGLWILFEEAPAHVLRNMRSIGLDLRRWVDAGLLRIWAARPSAFGMEAHLAMLAGLIEESVPSLAVMDGIAGLAQAGEDVTTMVARKIDLLKSRGITTVVTMLDEGEKMSVVGVSSLVDTWLLLRNTETSGERNRLLSVVKSRGTAHSNQVREFLLTSHGIELVDVYVGPGGVLAGSARLAQEGAERHAELRRAEEQRRRQRELRLSVSEREASLAVVQAQLDSDREELERIGLTERHRSVAADAEQLAMVRQRGADALPARGER